MLRRRDARRRCAAAAALWIALHVVPCAASPESLSALLAREPPPAEVLAGICFVPLAGESGRAVFHHADRALPPASVQKIVTAAAALDLLGPDHRFKTRLLADAPIRSGKVEGNLYLRGDGDPYLVTERLWLLAREAAAAGLREVTGALVVEVAPIEDLTQTRRDEKTDSPYAAPVSLLAVNFNSIACVVRPGERAGDAASVEAEPFETPGIRWCSEARTVAPEGETSLQATRAKPGEGASWRISGTIRAGSAPVRIYRAAEDPAALAGAVVSGLLRQQGIAVQTARAGKTPEDAVLIAELPSLSLGMLVQTMNIWSNNFMADLLLAVLGGGGSGVAGAGTVRDWVARRVPGSPPEVADGSGLSTRNRISARQVARLLIWAHGREKVFADLMASFPRPGEEGTLRRRFASGDVPAVRGKTGTLGDAGVSSIAGYVDHPERGRYAFCILQQVPPGSKESVATMRLREDTWLREFTRP